MPNRNAPPRWLFTNGQADALKERFGWEVNRNDDESLSDAIERTFHTKDGSRLAAEKGAR